jgi:NAD(P)-dependent dehydrogenase (short-subunit alcohol dehydrogenase family)
MSEAKRLGGDLLSTKTDTYLFTNGIVPARKREETADGLERDMAVSFLSRFVALHHLIPRLDAATPRRVFLMGFPGAGQAGTLGDLNAERAYSVNTVHMNTVAGNEALVLHGAAAWRARGVRAYGLNPGLVRTGIRSNLLGTGPLAQAAEAALGYFTPSPAQYAEAVVPLLYAPELDAHSGAMFNQKAAAILPSAGLDPARVTALLAESEALLARVTPAAITPAA